jgi:hypothetical protein
MLGCTLWAPCYRRQKMRAQPNGIGELITPPTCMVGGDIFESHASIKRAGPASRGVIRPSVRSTVRAEACATFGLSADRGRQIAGARCCSTAVWSARLRRISAILHRPSIYRSRVWDASPWREPCAYAKHGSPWRRRCTSRPDEEPRRCGRRGAERVCHLSIRKSLRT